MGAQRGRAGRRETVGIAAAVLGMTVLCGLAGYWLMDRQALLRALELSAADDDARAMAAVASAFRAAFDVFAVAVMALPLKRREWRSLGQLALLTAAFIPGVDAVIWLAVLPEPSPVAVLPHLLVALPLLTAWAALSGPWQAGRSV